MRKVTDARDVEKFIYLLYASRVNFIAWQFAVNPPSSSSSSSSSSSPSFLLLHLLLLFIRFAREVHARPQKMEYT